MVVGHRESKLERIQLLKAVFREKHLRRYCGAAVTCLCCCVHCNTTFLFLQALDDSSVLLRVSDDIQQAFIAKLTTEWLPDKRFELLYRGSRDGMTAAAFHDKCVGKGPTLVLVAGQSARQPVCVFGGYAGKSWERGPEIGWETKGIDARDSFLFTVLNPLGDGIVKMAVNERSKYAGLAMLCHAGCGPLFYYGFAVRSSSASPTAVFDEGSWCGLVSYGTFGDPLGRGYQTFTGAQCFKPLEIEVWSVC
jgi:hypothetical protein